MPVSQSVILEVREKLGNPTSSTLTDAAIERELGRALNHHNDNYVWSEIEVTDPATQKVIPDSEVYLVVWLTVANLALSLAASYAEAVDFTIENDELQVDLSDIMSNYLKLHERYTGMYNEYGNSNQIEVHTYRRRSWETGKIAKWYEDETQ